MAIDYSNLRDVAERLIVANGRTVTLSKRDRAAADPAKPWEGPADPGTDITIDVTAVIVPFDEEIIEGEIIKLGDQRAYVSAKNADLAAVGGSAAVQEFDTMIDNGMSWRIIKVRTIKPASIGILYDIQLRGGS